MKEYAIVAARANGQLEELGRFADLTQAWDAGFKLWGELAPQGYKEAEVILRDQTQNRWTLWDANGVFHPWPSKEDVVYTNYWSDRSTWRPSEQLIALPEVGDKEKPGYTKGHRFGLENFPSGVSPSCSRHGAMNRVTDERDWWRCQQSECNIGCEWLRSA